MFLCKIKTLDYINSYVKYDNCSLYGGPHNDNNRNTRFVYNKCVNRSFKILPICEHGNDTENRQAIYVYGNYAYCLMNCYPYEYSAKCHFCAVNIYTGKHYNMKDMDDRNVHFEYKNSSLFLSKSTKKL